MATSHFLKFIDIVKFKCFSNFKVDELERDNLISGKNNIGKTAFMEACYINTRAMNIKRFFGALVGIKTMRENLNILMDSNNFKPNKFFESSNSTHILSNINTSAFLIEELDGLKYYNFTCANQHSRINANLFSSDSERAENIKFIDSFGLANEEIISNYASIQKKDQEIYLNSILKEFDATIEGFKVFDNLPQCKVNEQWLEITEMGDGTRHIVSLVTSLFQAENGYLFIDELGNGIHYTYLDKVWEIIFKLSKELNCQVFVTTHSKECIEAFNRQNSDNEGSYFEFYRSKKTNAITYKKRDKEQLEYSLSHNGEFRGE